MIGVFKFFFVYIDAHGSGRVDEKRFSDVLCDMMDFLSRGIREYLGLNKLIYVRILVYGYFGCVLDSDGGFLWEKMDLVDGFKLVFGIN